MTSADSRYTFGPLERRGVLAGLRAGQLVSLLLGGLAVVVVFRVLPGGPALFLAVLAVLAALGAAFTPVAGRGLDEWAPTVAAWTLRGVTGGRATVVDTPARGRTRTRGPRVSPPPTLRGVSIVEAPLANGARIGVVRDRRARAWTGVLAVSAGSFALLSTADKARRLDGWAQVLAGLTRPSCPVDRVQWLERTVPDAGDAIGRDLAVRMTAGRGHPAVRSYLDLVDHVQPVTQQHEMLVAVRVGDRKAHRAIRKAGGGDAGACAVLVRELEQLVEQLHGAELLVEGALPPRLLAKALRTGFDPSTRAGMARIAADDPEREGTAPTNAWPHATETTWSTFRADGSWHATYWVAEWPRVGVGPDFLSPLLLWTQAMRTVSLVMEPQSPLRAVRDVERTLNDYETNRRIRARYEFAAHRRTDLEEEAARVREQELAVGHGEYRFSGYVTVTAATPDELEEACAEVEQHAQQSRLELHRMYGQQDEAFTFSLPVARGLR
ncbi:hypothetical protein BH20ACT9_BH20ACT9_10930 [soil metagenome]